MRAITTLPTSLRLMKALLVGLIAVFAFLVGLNNIVDYGSNFAFVQHVLSMDTTFDGNKLMWRAIELGALQHLGYWLIIAMELLTAVLCGFGAWQLFNARLAPVAEFNRAKIIAAWGLVTGIVLWFGGFMTVGAEWFLMWQSPSWNGQQAAFRFIVCIFACLIFLFQPEPE